MHFLHAKVSFRKYCQLRLNVCWYSYGAWTKKLPTTKHFRQQWSGSAVVQNEKRRSVSPVYERKVYLFLFCSLSCFMWCFKICNILRCEIGRFSQRCWCRLTVTGTWRRVDFYIGTMVSVELSVSIFRVDSSAQSVPIYQSYSKRLHSSGYYEFKARITVNKRHSKKI